MRQLIDNRMDLPKIVMPEFDHFFKTFPISTAECERGFSLMNNIFTKLCTKLTINNIAHLMFVNINYTTNYPLHKWSPETYVKS